MGFSGFVGVLLALVAISAPPIYEYLKLQGGQQGDDGSKTMLLFGWIGVALGGIVWNLAIGKRKVDSVAKARAAIANNVGGRIDKILRVSYGDRSYIPAHAAYDGLDSVRNEILDGIVVVAETTLSHPQGCTFTSNLFVYRDRGYDIVECIAVNTHGRDSFTTLPVSSPGLGRAEDEGIPIAIADTRDPKWDGHFAHATFGEQYRSFAVFLLDLAGQAGVNGGFVTIDCTNPYVFTEKRLSRYFVDSLRPYLKLLGFYLLHKRFPMKPLGPGS